MTPKETTMRELVQLAHAHQTRNGGTLPYWVHCQNVAVHLRQVLNITQEGYLAEREQIILASLGHDLYEDTAITRQEIVEQFGDKVDELIEWLTNRHGDSGIHAYCEQFASMPETVALIKLADLHDNLVSATQGFKDGHLSLKWMTNFLLPILSPQWEQLRVKPFSQYPQTAVQLRTDINQAWRKLHQAINGESDAY